MHKISVFVVHFRLPLRLVWTLKILMSVIYLPNFIYWEIGLQSRWSQLKFYSTISCSNMRILPCSMWQFAQSSWKCAWMWLDWRFIKLGPLQDSPSTSWDQSPHPCLLAILVSNSRQVRHLIFSSKFASSVKKTNTKNKTKNKHITNKVQQYNYSFKSDQNIYYQFFFLYINCYIITNSGNVHKH